MLLQMLSTGEITTGAMPLAVILISLSTFLTLACRGFVLESMQLSNKVALATLYTLELVYAGFLQEVERGIWLMLTNKFSLSASWWVLNNN